MIRRYRADGSGDPRRAILVVDVDIAPDADDAPTTTPASSSFRTRWCNTVIRARNKKPDRAAG